MQQFTLQGLDVTFLRLFFSLHFTEFLTKWLYCLQEMMENIQITITAANQVNRPNIWRMYTHHHTWFCILSCVWRAARSVQWTTELQGGDSCWRCVVCKGIVGGSRTDSCIRSLAANKWEETAEVVELYLRNPPTILHVISHSSHLPTFSSLGKFPWRRYCLL